VTVKREVGVARAGERQVMLFQEPRDFSRDHLFALRPYPRLGFKAIGLDPLGQG
jgi:hypothetical protein